MEKPVLIVMAAGMGSRYGGLKQMDPVGTKGELIIDFSIYDAIQAGFEKVIFVIKKEIEEEFKKIMKIRKYPDIKIEYAYQDINDLPEGFSVPENRIKPWGTCHAVLSCRKHIDGPFAVINADDFYGAEAFKSMYENLLRTEDDDKFRYCMIGYLLENTLTENGHVARGVCDLSKDDYLEKITERTKIIIKDNVIQFTEDEENWKEICPSTIVSMNFWGFTKSFITEIETLFPKVLVDIIKNNPLKGEFYLPYAVDYLLINEKATVKVISSKDKWYGVTYHEDKPMVVSALKNFKDEGIYPENLW